MKISYILISIAVMAALTYIIRVTPMVVFRKQIKNRWIQSFLFYIPYTVLATMTFPSIFTSTGSIASATAGCVVAVILAYFKRGLLTVAIGAAASAFIFQLAGL